MCYYCQPCDAYVGCHENTKKPLGTMTNAEGREWRKKAHAVFDPLWKSGKMSRDTAYGILRRHFNKEVHIGESDIEMCKAIVELLDDRNNKGDV